MAVCPHCANSVDLIPLQGTRQTCPHCGESVIRNSIKTVAEKGTVPFSAEDSAKSGQSPTVLPEQTWIDVARVSNLAEAGFLTDELVGMDIDARIHQLDEFSAITDRWQAVYLIRVPSDRARAAAAWIRQQLSEEPADTESGYGPHRFAEWDDAIDAAFWRPAFLVVLAGVASFMLGQQFSARHGQRMVVDNPLSTAVDRIGRPLVSEPAAGGPRHRLTFDRRRSAWYLDVDRDGDGQYDSRQQFNASGAAW